MNRAGQLALALLLVASATTASGAENHALTRADRIEYRPADGITLWELQGWYGGDIHKFWWKVEGDAGRRAADETEFGLFYSRAIKPYFDLQVGAHIERHDAGNDISAAVGVEGTLPYWVEIDATAYLADNGDIQLRVELEREVLLSQRIVAIPRIKINASLQDIPERNLERGVNDTAVELRLGYKVHHKVVPYLGVSWHRHFGEVGRTLAESGEEDAAASVIIGVRAWF